MIESKLKNTIKYFINCFQYHLIFDRNKKKKLVLDFYKKYNDFRSLENCSKFTGVNYEEVRILKEYLYFSNMLGLYFFKKNTSPQKYMRRFILERFPFISAKSYILEIGPGQKPLFSHRQYGNWFGVDKNFIEREGIILFRDNKWAKDIYPQGKILQGDWGELAEIGGLSQYVGKFDLVIASHSYEHVFSPIQSLVEARKMLRKNGILALFVPDPFTDDINTKDPTHTLYLVSEMIQEFFKYAEGYINLKIEAFRPNADILITARKK